VDPNRWAGRVDVEHPGLARRWWALYLTALIAGLPVYFYVLDGIAQQLWYDAYGLSAVGAILVGVRAHRPPRRAPWWAFAAGLGLFTVGDVVFNLYELHGGSAPVPSVADGLYFAAYPVLAWGMVLLVRSRAGHRDLISVLDGGIVASGVGVLAWVFVMDTYFDDPTLGLPAKVVAIGYPVLDLLLLAVAARLVLSPVRRNGAFLLLATGVVVLLVTDGFYAVALVHDTSTSGGLIDFGYLLSYALWGAAALHPSMARVTNVSETGERRSQPGLLLALGVAAVMAPVVLVIQDLRGGDRDVPLLASMAAVMFGLVLARLGLVARALDRSNDERSRDERRFGSLIRKSSDVVTLIGPDGTIRYQSPGVEALLGLRPDELIGRVAGGLAHPADEVAYRAHLAEVVAGGLKATTSFECRFRHRDGSWRALDNVATNLLDDPDVDAVVINSRDVTDRQALEHELNRRAFHDPLTGLANRALFLDRVGHALTRAERLADPVAVLFLDLDDFKLVNDGLGHAAGDQLLVGVAERLARSIRAGDTVARFGGDEFAILLESGAMPTTAMDVAHRVAETLAAPFRVGPDLVSVQASVGVAFGRPPPDTPESVLRDADLAMYLAKQNGKGRFEMFRPAMHDEAVERLALTADLRQAIERAAFEVFYQPIVNVEGTRVVGAEALVRWPHPRRGLVSPLEFIDVAESTGLIVPLGRWVLAEACRQTQSWRKAGVVDDDFYISVNLSGRQLQDGALVRDVEHVLATSGLPARTLMLEITEGGVAGDLDLALARLRALKDLGLRLALDDYGTGYSSLNRLEKLPVDVVKIDKSFIDRLTETPEGRALVRSVIDVTRALGLSSIAEGVERPEQLAALEELGCDHVQGYLFARPMPGEDTALMLAQFRRHALRVRG
jgi:diguanylate cyclase (GGDEF)-like protein/PAS domain S-box-containing protein